jgi:hypothetical protein
MDVKAGPLRQLGTDLGVFVGSVVVDEQVDLQALWKRLPDLPEESQKLLLPVAGFSLGDHFSRGHIQGSKQGGGAVSDVVVGDSFHISQAHGQ